MRLFKNIWFSRFAEKEAILDEDLKALAKQIESGQFDADLGGGVYKQRLARQGAGKSSGYRIMSFFIMDLQSRIEITFLTRNYDF